MVRFIIKYSDMWNSFYKFVSLSLLDNSRYSDDDLQKTWNLFFENQFKLKGFDVWT